MIRITRGIYGHNVNGRIRPRTPCSEPFEASPEEERRLVSIGIAEYVEGGEGTDNDGEMSKAAHTSGEANTGEEPMEEMNINSLRKLAKQSGVSAAGTKADIIGRIKALSEDTDDSEDDAEELEGDAPAFDAELPS